MRILVCVVLLHLVAGWKPVVGPIDYSAKHHTQLAESDGTATGSAGHTITYHGNIFTQPASASGDGSDLDEGRLLTGVSANKFLDQDLTALGLNADSGHCSLDKYALDHEGTIQYDQEIPSLSQFTLCAWMRFINHSGDHSIFTYSVDGEPREIQFWVANAKGSSFISLAVHGQSLYRLNYPLKMRKWHHACTSWNGKTGEWQLWLEAERVGRGFHNRIVGHVVKPHGVVYSGGPSITGPVSSGIHMEVTMVQLYKVALSAGKAHRDHKHHHVHHFDHNGPVTSTARPPPSLPPQPMIPANALIVNGQINTRLRVNYAGSQPQPGQPTVGPIPVGPTVSPGFSRVQFTSGPYSTSQFFGNRAKQPKALSAPQQSFVFPQASTPSSLNTISDSIQFIDGVSGANELGHIVFKRHDIDEKRSPPTKAIVKRQAKTVNAPVKRALVSLTDGTIVDDGDIGENAYDFEGLTQFGAAAFQEALTSPKHANIEDEIREHDREPAEGEVRAVLSLCSACDIEPFQGAIVMAWKETKITVEGGLRGHSLGGCGHF